MIEEGKSLLVKPLGGKAYGSIPHLPGSRMGPGDHHCHDGQAQICLGKPRKKDVVTIQVKYDGSCVAVARIGDELVALGRAGWPAQTSPYKQHQLFADWVRRNAARFDGLAPGERICGEWLAQAHGTRYDLAGREPFVAFDWFRAAGGRATVDEFYPKWSVHFALPTILADGPRHISEVREFLSAGAGFKDYGALDPLEGAVWRVEREGKVDFLAKWVRPDKVDGFYLPEMRRKRAVERGEAVGPGDGIEPVWNWRPS